MKTENKKIKSYTDIIGWFDFQDIYDMSVEKAIDGDKFLEVGCFMGKSTSYLLQKIAESGKKISVYVIDIFEPECVHHNDLIMEVGKGKSLYEIFSENIAAFNFPERIGPYCSRGRSDEMYKKWNDNTFQMIFIDAAHDYESVKADLNNFYPKLRPGGIFAGHDYGEKSCGVGQAVDEFVKENNLKLDVMTASWVLIKP